MSRNLLGLVKSIPKRRTAPVCRRLTKNNSIYRIENVICFFECEIKVFLLIFFVTNNGSFLDGLFLQKKKTKKTKEDYIYINFI